MSEPRTPSPLPRTAPPYGVPRRCRIDLLTSEERLIRDAIGAIERMPYADVRLTSAQTKLGEAGDLLADFLEGVELPKGAQCRGCLNTRETIDASGFCITCRTIRDLLREDMTEPRIGQASPTLEQHFREKKLLGIIERQKARVVEFKKAIGVAVPLILKGGAEHRCGEGPWGDVDRKMSADVLARVNAAIGDSWLDPEPDDVLAEAARAERTANASPRPSVSERPDLYECASCGTKPGSPALCVRCLEARTAAGRDWIGPHFFAPKSDPTEEPRVADATLGHSRAGELARDEWRRRGSRAIAAEVLSSRQHGMSTRIAAAAVEAALHPLDRCTCAGEGQCAWCVSTAEREEVNHGAPGEKPDSVSDQDAAESRPTTGTSTSDATRVAGATPAGSFGSRERGESSASVTLDDIERAIAASSPAPWRWATSNSWRRLTSADGRDGGVLYPFASAGDGHPNCAISEEDMVFIALARDALPELVAEVRRLQNVIRTGGAMYRLERATMGIAGGIDESGQPIAAPGPSELTIERNSKSGG